MPFPTKLVDVISVTGARLNVVDHVARILHVWPVLNPYSAVMWLEFFFLFLSNIRTGQSVCCGSVMEGLRALLGFFVSEVPLFHSRLLQVFKIMSNQAKPEMR
jgi:hypothetical protein